MRPGQSYGLASPRNHRQSRFSDGFGLWRGLLDREFPCAIECDMPEDFHRDRVVGLHGGEAQMNERKVLFDWQRDYSGKCAGRNGARREQNALVRGDIGKLNTAGTGATRQCAERCQKVERACAETRDETGNRGDGRQSGSHLSGPEWRAFSFAREEFRVGNHGDERFAVDESGQNGQSGPKCGAPSASSPVTTHDRVMGSFRSSTG